MLITCPTCAMSYQVDVQTIGASGRMVRCTHCRTVWNVPPPMEGPLFRVPEPSEAIINSAEQAASDESAIAYPAAHDAGLAAPGITGQGPMEPPATFASASGGPEIAAATPAREQPVALADIPIPGSDSPALIRHAGNGALPAAKSIAIENGRSDIESVAARRRSRPAARRRRNQYGAQLPAAIAALAVICAALLAWRKDIVRQVPQLASFYAAIGLPVNLRGLAFTEVRIGNQVVDGVPVLVVEGLVASTASVAVEVPRLRFAVRNAAGAEIYAWTAVPEQQVLAPGERLPFRSQLASPPVDTHNVQVRFFTRRDAAVAALP
jgi:predicted Zn finger-like uncharacterized protein